MIYVIGSGPSGVASTYALLKRGCEVTMLDAGINLENDRQNLLKKIQKTPFEKWDPTILQLFKSNTKSSIQGIPMKMAYGSDFPFQKIFEFGGIETNNVGCLPTLSRGGFSSIWGANVLPYRDEDISGWPITSKDLRPHYEAVSELLTIAGFLDDLEELFPSVSKMHEFSESSQARSLLKDLNKHKTILRANGIFFGHSRLAVRFYDTHEGPGCVYCGLCMYGCPHELIYNSSHSIKKLMEFPKFHYQGNVYVEKISEQDTDISIYGSSIDNHSSVVFKGRQVFLACGPIATTKILMESENLFNVSLKMKDSQYFLLPCLRFRSDSAAEEERLHTLSQVYLEILDTNLSHRLIHLQCYMYNDLYELALKNLFGPFYTILKFFIKPLLRRLIVIQGYLHSENSSHIEIWIDKKDKKTLLRLKGIENWQGRKIVRKVVSKLYKYRKLLGMIPLAPLLRVAEPGRGYHTGGTFPMNQKPGRFETDILGRPNGFKRLHVVDSTIFPSIPATTITFTSMANAHRIASEVELL